jgi:hypothetical protein
MSDAKNDDMIERVAVAMALLQSLGLTLVR